MLPHSLLLFLLFIIPTAIAYTFSYDDGMDGSMTVLSGASITSGALMLTNGEPRRKGNALSFQYDPISSFSTTFVFIIIPPENLGGVSAHGLAFKLSNNIGLLYSSMGFQYLSLTNTKSNGNITNQLFAVELDTFKNPELADIDDNHVGIDVNSIVSINSHTAGYYNSNDTFSPLRLASGEPMQVWVEYDDNSHNLNVSLAPYLERKHYIIGWSFNTTGEAQLLDYPAMSQIIADVRRKAQNPSHIPKGIILPTAISAAFMVLVILVILYLKKKAKESVKLKIEGGPPYFTYKDLATATRGFSDRMLLGKGGFGKVYKGVIQTSKQNVAIKRVSPESKQGMKEFIAEITILGHLRHRNLVQLLGYSRHKNDLLLVYDYMPKGSLDRVLHDQDMQILNWVHRLNIIKGIASGLFYLHEDWEKVVIHRDIKTSNVLLDNEMNARLGDFGLARLHNHGTEAHTTHLAGTWGYIAPELARHRKATEATDVFAFGVLMLEVACGRHPIVVNDSGEPVLLTDWVFHALESGSVLRTVDSRLEDYIREEVELVLKLGLLCSHPVPSARPCMRLVLQYLEKDAPLTDFQPCFFRLTSRDEGFDQYSMSSVATATTGLSGGR